MSDAVVLQPYFLLLSLCADSGRGEPPPQPLLFSQLPAPPRSTVGEKKAADGLDSSVTLALRLTVESFHREEQ